MKAQRAKICTVRQVQLAPSVPATHLLVCVISGAKLSLRGKKEKVVSENLCYEIGFAVTIVLSDGTGKSNITVQSNLTQKAAWTVLTCIARPLLNLNLHKTTQMILKADAHNAQ